MEQHGELFKHLTLLCKNIMKGVEKQPQEKGNAK
jgi:hypothetical protein